jgi:hypothetical protein
MLPAVPPTVTQSHAALKEGVSGWPVYALQRALNDAGSASLAPDGGFGARTTTALKAFQTRANLKADGVCGTASWRALSGAVCRRLDRDKIVPAGLAAGFARGEGGNNAAAVNPSVAGGVDCGLFQLRCYGPPFDHQALGLAFSPYRAGVRALTQLRERAAQFARPAAGCPFTPLELAVLAHNWPWAAQTYHDRGRLAMPARPAYWVPASLPASVRTYDGWAHYYVKTMTS